MKVALISEWLDPWRGGAETSSRQFVHRLMDAGVEVHVFTRSRPSPTPGLHVHTVSGAAMSRVRQSVTFSHRVEAALRCQPFDLVHAISAIRGADLYQPRGGTVAESMDRNLSLLQTPWLRRIKKQASRLNLKQRFGLSLERRIMNDPLGPTIVCISGYVVDQLRRHYALPDSRIRLIYNGVEPDDVAAEGWEQVRLQTRRAMGVAKHECVALLVAHNFRLKGVARWLEATAILRARGIAEIHTWIVGKGAGPRWNQMVTDLGSGDRVVFLGANDRVAELRRAADFLVHPTYYDPCSRVVLEAIVAGLPSITTRWDGSAEIVAEAKGGFILDDPGDIVTLAAYAERLLDPAVRAELGANALRAAARVSMERNAVEMLRLYEEVKSRKEAS